MYMYTHSVMLLLPCVLDNVYFVELAAHCA